MKPILVATDFSAPARHAANRAALLAQETRASLTLMHVLPSHTLDELRKWLGAGHALEQQLRADARQQLRRLADELQNARQLTLHTHEATGSVLDEITRQAELLDAGVLVLGARGTGLLLRRLVLGTTSARMLWRTTRPLLVVRRIPHQPYQRVLVAVDFSAWSANAVALARRVAPHARLVLLHAFQVPFEEKLQFAGVDAATIGHYRRQNRVEATQRLHDFAHDVGLKPDQWTLCVVEGDPSQRIVEQERKFGCDLVVVGKHGQSAMEDLFLGSVTKHVLAEGSCDVLASAARES